MKRAELMVISLARHRLRLAISLLYLLPFLASHRAVGIEEPPTKALGAVDGRIDIALDQTKAGELLLVERVRILAPVNKVWEAYTTSKGYASWAAPVAEVNLKVGGAIRAHYDSAATVGDPQTITLHIVNYVPEKMLTLQTDPAENWPDILKDQAKHLYNVILFQRLDDQTTQIVSYGLGYRDTPEMRRMLAFFKQANVSLYRKLIAMLEEK